MKQLFFSFCLAVLALVGCNSKPKQAGNAEPNSKLITNNHASGFKIVQVDGGFILTVGHPTNHQAVFQTFGLYSQKPLKLSTPVDFQIKIPIERVAALATNHIGFVNALQKSKSLIGIADPFRVYSEAVKRAIKNEDIANLGGSMTPNNEMIMALRPDVILKSGFPSTRENDKVLRQAGLPIIYTVAWTEKTPLARAEWIKVFGILYNNYELADSIFTAVEQNYLTTKKMASRLTKKPLVFCGNSFKGVWYLPGGNSYISSFIADAGGNYLFANDTTTGSMSVSFEVVYNTARNADVWLNVQENTINEMIQNDSRYVSFKPVQNKQVYNRKGRCSDGGGNDYFETGTWRPDIVLNDLIHILHPKDVDSALVFYKRLK